ncbi:GntR family transcriptional regulator [Mycolicibacterium llatzerense]|uniref:GntR family transcriptional regulator n=1 Tax=Mycolicibacterium llatzerense TaxID=280871 RepID=UPI0021B67C31|nr:GntR family transcriptional regulator [Mycolicibacterium llatzerense]MCT7362918.1 GntR family transcriptional regulator [Mycolicibacterium llatzerense]
MTTQATELVSQIAMQIVDYIQTNNIQPGQRLVERRLAEDLRVSRSPIRGALRLLEQDGVVGVAERGGYVVNNSAATLTAHAAETKQAARERNYLLVAKDRLEGALPDKITEKELIRRYALTRAEATELLRRMTQEGWIERLPGYGWEFLPMLTSETLYRDSYNFRLVIEPAAMLEPTFVLDRPVLQASRDQQQRLADGWIWDLSDAEVFDLNSHHHEVIISCSRNAYYIDALNRINKTRRLIEYRHTLERDNGIVKCREHVQIADLLLDGHNARASTLMHRHLMTVIADKSS